MTVLGYELTLQQGALVAAGLYALNRFGGFAPLLAKLKAMFGKGQTAAQALLTPKTDIGDVMEYLKALDAYSDANNLEWAEPLKKMVADAANVEFTKEPTNEAG